MTHHLKDGRLLIISPSSITLSGLNINSFICSVEKILEFLKVITSQNLLEILPAMSGRHNVFFTCPGQPLM